ncbi:UNVERIFIED_CONTAM: hypothetical protein PYX00_011036 [Menopon gallinae]|uniref:Cytochrome P450 n=1 Tax=Menopon gallinae TaxID=328185 RepID=A0AAW2H6Y0_9NEOP
MTDLMSQEIGKNECDLARYVTHCALDNICETAMGISVNSLTSGANSKYVQSIFRMGKIVVNRMFNPILYTDASFMLSPLGWEHSKILKTLHGFTSKVIKEKKEIQTRKRAMANSLDTIKEDANSVGVVERKSFLEMLLESQAAHSLTEQGIREEVDTFMFEGHDTTAASVVFALFELGHHPDIQERVYNEMREIFGDSDRMPTYQDLMQMSYLKRVIQEILRLYPSVPVISRKFDVDFRIRDYVIPANTELVLVLYYIHRNPDIFPDPDNFDPDRFLPDISEKRHPFAYVPFSAGQRNCIGQKFAMLEELVILSSILRKYTILSLSDRASMKVVPEMILRPSDVLRWRIEKRH